MEMIFRLIATMLSVVLIGTGWFAPDQLWSITGYAPTSLQMGGGDRIDRPLLAVPVASPDTYRTTPNTLLGVAAPGVLQNDSDSDPGDTLTAVLDNDVSHGTLTLNSDGSFSYTPNTDYVGEDSFTYHAIDTTNNPSNTVTVTIQVDNNPTDISLSASSVAENQPVGTVVGTFTTTDPDAGQSFTYSMVTGTGDTDNSSFTIAGNSLQTAAVFDYETKTSYSIRVQTDDGLGGTFQKQFTITVTNTNDPPTDITLSASNVAENQAAGTVVGTFSTTDQNVGDTFTYTLVAGIGDTDNASFTITGNQLKTAAIFNYEVKSSYSIRVQTSDNQGATFQKVFTITVTDVNETPTDITLNPSSVAENLPVGTVVGTFSTTDPDFGQTFTYTLVHGTGGQDYSSFTIVGNELRTAEVFNYEVKNIYNIRVETNDGHGGTFQKPLTITVTNVNESPTDITLSASSVAENMPVGTVVGTFTTTDPDVGDTFTYSLVAGTGDTDNASFTIVGNALQTAAIFDYDVKSSYSIRVQTTDSLGATFQKQFTITVTNVNEPPTDITLNPSSVAENQPVGTQVGTFTTTDPDVGQTFTYSLVAGTGDIDNASFTIVGNALQTAAIFNYEVKNSYSIRVQTSDIFGATFQKAFTITVTNVNEPPTDITLSVSSVAENQPVGTVVGTFASIDPDFGDITFTYTLVAGTGDTDNASFTIVGNALQTAAIFNYEVKNSYSIRVQTSDIFGGTFQKIFTITVTNVNEPPTNITLSASSVAENKPVGTVVGTFTTTDPDVGQTFTYSLVAGTGSTDNSSFTIVGNALQTAAIFNYEVKNSYSIRVQTTDNLGATFQKVFTITVTNVNEAPTDIILSASSVPENQPIGTVVGTFATTDPDVGDVTFTYTLVAGTGSTDNSSFTIVGSQLQTAAVFNYEVKSSYSIRVQTSDGHGGIFQKVFTITVTNVNEAPVATNDAYSISKNSDLNMPAPGVLINDSDVDSSGLTTSLVSGPSCNPSGCGTLEFRSDGSFTYHFATEYLGTVTFQYRVSDGGLYSNTATVTISVISGSVFQIQWLAPIIPNPPGYKEVADNHIWLQVNVLNCSGTCTARYIRWDVLKRKWVDLGTVGAPYRFLLDTSILYSGKGKLNPGWNQVSAIAYDNSGHSSGMISILLKRRPKEYFPVMVMPYLYLTSIP